MKRITLGVVFSLLVCASPAFAWDCADPAIDCNTLIITTKTPLPGLTMMGASPIVGHPNQQIIEVPAGEDPNAYLKALEELHGLAQVEPALVTELALSESLLTPSDAIDNSPNDPLFDEQDHFGGITGELLQMDSAWSLLTSTPIIIAVIDSGIDYNHIDLNANMWINRDEIPFNNIDDDNNGYTDDVYGYNFYHKDSDPMDEHMHGTHVAGIIGAVGDNGAGVAGLLWNVEIMALRFTDDDGIGNTAKAIEAIHYAVANGAEVINMSWTVKASATSGGSTALRDVIRSYSNQGIVFVAASGNGDAFFRGINLDESPVFPASIVSDNLLAVGALAQGGGAAGYSNYGPNTVHLLAPGTSILSTLPGDRYGRMSGTSAATAFVSAAAAMIISESPDFSAADVKNIILNTINYDADFEGLIMTAGSLNLGQSLISNDVSRYISAATSTNTDSSDTASASSGGGCSLASSGKTTSSTASYIMLLLVCGLLIIQRQRH